MTFVYYNFKLKWTIDALITSDPHIWRVEERGAISPMNGFMVHWTIDELITSDPHIWRVGERGAISSMNGFMVVNCCQPATYSFLQTCWSLTFKHYLLYPVSSKLIYNLLQPVNFRFKPFHLTYSPNLPWPAHGVCSVNLIWPVWSSIV